VTDFSKDIEGIIRQVWAGGAQGQERRKVPQEILVRLSAGAFSRGYHSLAMPLERKKVREEKKRATKKDLSKRAKKKIQSMAGPFICLLPSWTPSSLFLVALRDLAGKARKCVARVCRTGGSESPLETLKSATTPHREPKTVFLLAGP